MSALDDEELVSALLPAFIEEANEQLNSFESLLLDHETQVNNPDFLDALFRCAHTVKGSAGVFGLEHVVGFAHQVEGVLDRVREGQVELSESLSTLLLRSNDALRKLVASVPTEGPPEDVVTREALAKALSDLSGRSHANAQAPAAPSEKANPAAQGGYLVSSRFGKDTFRHGLDPLAVMNYLSGLGTLEVPHSEHADVPPLEDLDPESCHLALKFRILSDAPRSAVESAFDFVRDETSLEISPIAEHVAETVAAPRAPTQAAASRPSAKPPIDEGGYIRVLANRLDEVINLLGELVIAGAGASMLAQRSRQRELVEANRQVSRLIEGIRNSTLQLRMVPIGETFSRFRRVVRDTASELGKEVSLQIDGGDTELDKAIRRDFIHAIGKLRQGFVILLDADRALNVREMSELCELAQEAAVA